MMTLKSDQGMKKALFYVLFAAFFFWFQRYIPNLSFMYKDKISLAVRCLYAVALADTAICTIGKFRSFGRAGVNDREQKKPEKKEDETEITKEGNPNFSPEKKEESPAWYGGRLGDLIFYLSFGLCYVLLYVTITTIGAVIPLYGGINRLGVTLCCMVSMFLFNRNKPKDIKILIFQMFLYISAIGYMGMYGEIWVFATVVFVVTSSDREFMTIARIAFRCNLIMILTAYVLSMTGVIEFVIRDGKNSYGFVGANETSMEIFFFEVMYFFLRYCEKKKNAEKIKDNRTKNPIETGRSILGTVLDMLILLPSIIIILRFTKTRTSIVAILALAVGVLVYKLSGIFPMEKWNRNLRSLFDKAAFVVGVPIHLYICIFSFIATYNYDSENPYKWISTVGKFFFTFSLTERLRLGKLGLEQYVPKLFGNDIVETFVGYYFWLDNFYIKAYLKYGILLFISSLIVFTAVHYICWKKREYFTLFLLCVIAGLGFMEAPAGFIMYNVFPLMIFTRDRGILTCTGKEKT